MRILKALLKRLLALVASMAVVLLLMEGAVRGLGVTPPPGPVIVGRDTIPSSDAALRFENVPGGRSRLTFRDRIGGKARVSVHTINELGLRGPETTREKPPGVFRIACLGDSFTFGHGVNDDETWPAALERDLQRGDSGRRYEALNFGVSAYDVAQEVRLLELRVFDFDPDLVLIAWFLNDPPSARGDPPVTDIDAVLMRWLFPRQESALNSVRRWSRLVDVLADRAYRALQADYLATGYTSIYQDSHAAWRRAIRALQRAKALAAEHRVPLAIVMYPDLTRAGNVLVSHEAYKTVAAFCSSESIPCLDLEPAFLGRDLSALRVHALDRHPNGAGHAIAGAAVAAWLHETGLLPD